MTPAALADALGRDGRLLLAGFDNDLTAQLLAQGIPVMLGRAQGRDTPHDVFRDLCVRAVAEHRARTTTTRVRETWGWIFSLDVDVWKETVAAVGAPEDVYFPVSLDETPPPPAAPLLTSALAHLEHAESGYRKLTTCRLAAPVKDPPLFAVGRELAPVMARAPKQITEKKKTKRPEAAVNREHPHFVHLLELHAHEPALAAYCLAKALLLDQDHLLDRDLALMHSALAGTLPEQEAR